MRLFHWRAEFEGETYDFLTCDQTEAQAREALLPETRYLPEPLRRHLAAVLERAPYFTAAEHYPIVISYRKEIHG